MILIMNFLGTFMIDIMKIFNMRNFNKEYQKEYKLLHQAEKLLQENKSDEVILIFNELYGDDTNWMHAHLLTESNPEYSIYSKELNSLLHKYYINKLTDKVFYNI